MKKSRKIILCTIMLLTILSSIYTIYAANIWETANDFLQLGADKNGGMTGELTEVLKKVPFLKIEDGTKYKFEELIDFLWGLGVLAIFITTIVVGMKYMFVSPQEKSKIKEITVPYVIGVIVIFGALTIWKFVIYVLDGTIN